MACPPGRGGRQHTDQGPSFNRPRAWFEGAGFRAKHSRTTGRCYCCFRRAVCPRVLAHETAAACSSRPRTQRRAGTLRRAQPGRGCRHFRGPARARRRFGIIGLQPRHPRCATGDLGAVLPGAASVGIAATSPRLGTTGPSRPWGGLDPEERSPPPATGRLHPCLLPRSPPCPCSAALRSTTQERWSRSRAPSRVRQWPHLRLPHPLLGPSGVDAV